MSPGVKSDEELLKALLADDYCHVCEAVLLFESQRLSHYEVCALHHVKRHFRGHFTLLLTVILHQNRVKNMLRGSECTFRPREPKRQRKKTQSLRLMLT